MLHNVTYTINYATIFVLNYARKPGILTLISTITFRLAYGAWIMDMPLPIAIARMADSADLLMIINESFNISAEGYPYIISLVSFVFHSRRDAMTRDDRHAARQEEISIKA